MSYFTQYLEMLIQHYGFKFCTASVSIGSCFATCTWFGWDKRKWLVGCGMVCYPLDSMESTKWNGVWRKRIWLGESLTQNHVLCMVMVKGFLRRFFYHLSTLASWSKCLANFKFVGWLSMNFGLILELRCCIFIYITFSEYIVRFSFSLMYLSLLLD